MDVFPLPVNKNQARKRTAQPQNWKAKIKRYSARTLPRIPHCEHKNNVFECNKVTGTILRKFHTAFYKNPVKSSQDAIILKCCLAVPILRKRPRTFRLDPTTGIQSATRATKQFTIKYNVKVDKKSITVCQKLFLAALCLKKGRVTNLVQKSFVSGEFPVEKRGGDRKTKLFEDIKASVHGFIRKLKCSEPHYCRSQTSTRKYLPSDLNIRKLYRLYKSECPAPAKESYFRHIFNTEYNLGFGSPNTDMCSTCIQLLEKIKTEKDEKKKEKYRIEKRVHSLRAKAFYSLLKTEEEGVKILSYDCQKNMNLPKVPDQSCYYSRQFYLFNFTIVEGTSKAPLNKHNVFANVWTENTLKAVKALKVKDVKNLLSKHFGEDWQNLEELNFYSNVINTAEILPENENDTEELECEPTEEPQLLIV